MLVVMPDLYDTYMQYETMSSLVETSTFNISIVDDIGNINFIAYGDQGYLNKIRRNITITYSAGGGSITVQHKCFISDIRYILVYKCHYTVSITIIIPSL